MGSPSDWHVMQETLCFPTCVGPGSTVERAWAPVSVRRSAGRLLTSKVNAENRSVFLYIYINVFSPPPHRATPWWGAKGRGRCAEWAPGSRVRGVRSDRSVRMSLVHWCMNVMPSVCVTYRMCVCAGPRGGARGSAPLRMAGPGGGAFAAAAHAHLSGAGPGRR
jgi:hypothetical protein